MNKVYTIGFTKKTLRDFIARLENAGVKRIVDIRLNRTSQLSGFAKSPDFEYILGRLGFEYIWVKELAPNKELLDKYREDMNWTEYEVNFKALMEDRNAKKTLDDLQLDKKISCFLCSEDKPVKCHRRLVAEMLDNFDIEHL